MGAFALPGVASWAGSWPSSGWSPSRSSPRTGGLRGDVQASPEPRRRARTVPASVPIDARDVRALLPAHRAGLGRRSTRAAVIGRAARHRCLPAERTLTPRYRRGRVNRFDGRASCASMLRPTSDNWGVARRRRGPRDRRVVGLSEMFDDPASGPSTSRSRAPPSRHVARPPRLRRGPRRRCARSAGAEWRRCRGVVVVDHGRFLERCDGTDVL